MDGKGKRRDPLGFAGPSTFKGLLQDSHLESRPMTVPRAEYDSLVEYVKTLEISLTAQTNDASDRLRAANERANDQRAESERWRRNAEDLEVKLHESETKHETQMVGTLV